MIGKHSDGGVRRNSRGETSVENETIYSEHLLKVLIIDDHQMILDLFEMYFSAVPGILLTVSSELEAGLDQLMKDGPFDIVLLGSSSPNVGGTIGLLRAIRENYGSPVAVMSNSLSQTQVDMIMDSGASGIVPKSSPMKTLVNAIYFMASGERYLPLELMGCLLASQNSQHTYLLSDKEFSVLTSLMEGRLNRQISAELQISESTVKMHMSAIFRKLGATNRTQAIIVARELGIA